MKPRISTARLPGFLEPMKAKLVDSRPIAGAWIYEIKFDGYRALALRGGTETRILSRNQKDLGKKFPTIAESIAKLSVQDAIIDGEIVALDEQGRSSFQLLQGFDMGTERPPIFFYAFDLLQLNGKDLKTLPIEETKSETGGAFDKSNWRNSLFDQLHQRHRCFWERPRISASRG